MQGLVRKGVPEVKKDWRRVFGAPRVFRLSPPQSAPQATTPTDATVTLRMQAQTAARFEDVLGVLAHVNFTGPARKDSRLAPGWDQTRSMGPARLPTVPKHR